MKDEGWKMTCLGSTVVAARRAGSQLESEPRDLVLSAAWGLVYNCRMDGGLGRSE